MFITESTLDMIAEIIKGKGKDVNFARVVFLAEQIECPHLMKFIPENVRKKIPLKDFIQFTNQFLTSVPTYFPNMNKFQQLYFDFRRDNLKKVDMTAKEIVQFSMQANSNKATDVIISKVNVTDKLIKEFVQREDYNWLWDFAKYGAMTQKQITHLVEKTGKYALVTLLENPSRELIDNYLTNGEEDEVNSYIYWRRTEARLSFKLPLDIELTKIAYGNVCNAGDLVNEFARDVLYVFLNHRDSENPKLSEFNIFCKLCNYDSEKMHEWLKENAKQLAENN